MRRDHLITPAMLALLAALSPARADILVGTAAPFAGANAALGEQIRRGTQQAIDDINATGGLRGERLVLKAVDDGCDPKKAIDAATQLVTAGVKFMAGHYCSGASIPASKIYETANILQISPASTHARFTDEGGWNVIRACPRDDAQGTAAGTLILKRFPNAKVVLLNDQSPASIGLTAKLREALASANMSPVIDEAYKPGAKDYSALAQKLRNANAEVVYLGGSYVESALIASALRGMGSTAQFIGSDALVTDDFWKSAGDTAEGTLMTFMADPQDFASARPVVEKFRAADASAEGHTIYAYAAIQLWVKAAEATGTTDSQRIASWLRGGNRVSTAAGTLSFDAKGDLKEPQIAWLRWTDGRYVDDAEVPPLPPQ